MLTVTSSSISIACWVVVFSPQIIQNFRRGSADGLSLLFLIVWLVGDLFNILGAVLQGVLPTMIMLAVYYTLADIVLLGQCFYYRGFTLRDEPSPTPARAERDDPEENPASDRGHKATEQTALLSSHHNAQGKVQSISGQSAPAAGERRHSLRDIIHPSSVDGTHLSPATPLVEPSPDVARPTRNVSTMQNIIFNISAIALVCAAGVLGWYVSPGSSKNKAPKTPDDSSKDASLTFDTLGQVFGYLCAVLYLGSRLPQLLLNYKRKSTEGVSLLFFLFACIGNLSYVLSILAYSPVCEGGSFEKTGHCRPGEAGSLYGRYILVNLSWLIGSFGTLLLDMAIFIQFFLYKDNEYVSGH